MGANARVALGVFAGVAIWSAAWVAGTAAAQAALPDLLDPARRLGHTGALLGYVAFSVVLSLLAGYTAAAIGRVAAMRAAWITGLLLLAIGIYFELTYWDLLPVWYHVVFLALLVPATVAGGRIRLS